MSLGKTAEEINRKSQVTTRLEMGWSPQMIADDLNLALSTVHYHIRAVRREWHETIIDSYDTMQAAKLNELAAVKRAAWQAWHQSQGTPIDREHAVDERTAIINDSSSDDLPCDERDELAERVYGRLARRVKRNDKRYPASPQTSLYLRVVLEAVKLEMSILGLIAPTVNADLVITPEQLEQMTDEQLDAAISQLRSATASSRTRTPSQASD